MRASAPEVRAAGRERRRHAALAQRVPPPPPQSRPAPASPRSPSGTSGWRACGERAADGNRDGARAERGRARRSARSHANRALSECRAGALAAEAAAGRFSFRCVMASAFASMYVSATDYVYLRVRVRGAGMHTCSIVCECMHSCKCPLRIGVHAIVCEVPDGLLVRVSIVALQDLGTILSGIIGVGMTREGTGPRLSLVVGCLPAQRQCKGSVSALEARKLTLQLWPKRGRPGCGPKTTAGEIWRLQRVCVCVPTQVHRYDRVNACAPLVSMEGCLGRARAR